MKGSTKAYIYALIAILFWSTVPTAFKTGLKELDVPTLLTIASAVSAIALFTILAINGKIAEIKLSSPGELAASALLGLINPFIYYLVLLNAYSLLPAQVAQPLNMIWPIILVFLSVPLLKQKIKTKSFIALFISFAGVYLISSQGSPFTRISADTKGVLLATGSSVLWALYFIFNMRDKRNEAVKLFLNFFFGTVYLMIFLVITGNESIFELNLSGISAAVYIGLFEMGITFFLWLKALQMAESTDKVSNLVYIAPFLSLVFVHFILKETVYYTTITGLVLIISGILVQNHKFARH